MRKFGIAAVVVFVLAFAGAALASGGSTKSSSTHTIGAFGKTVQLSRADSFNVGDQISLSDDLLTTANGRRLGTDGGVCTLVRVVDAATHSGTVQCDVTYVIGGRQITAQGLVSLTNGGFAGTHLVAITGGTGRFRNAHGEVTLDFVRPGEANLTFAIRP